MREKLLDPCRSAAPARVKPLQYEGATDRRLLGVEAVDIELVIVLGIGDRCLQNLLDVGSDTAVGETQFRQGRGGTLAADRLGDKVELTRAGAQPTQTRLRLGFIETARGGALAHLSSSSPACPRRARKRFGSAQTHRACDRSYSRSPVQE